MRKKQHHTAKRIYDRLKEKHRNDFDCSYRTVAQYVAEKKKSIYGVTDRPNEATHDRPNGAT